MSKTHSTAKSFSYAFDGLKEALKSEPNLRIHAAVALAAIAAAYIFRFSHGEWIILSFTIAFVFILELINTSLEALVDLVSPQIRPKAKLAKDVSAAAVFVSAFLAVTVGLILFLPKILK